MKDSHQALTAGARKSPSILCEFSAINQPLKGRCERAAGFELFSFSRGVFAGGRKKVLCELQIASQVPLSERAIQTVTVLFIPLSADHWIIGSLQPRIALGGGSGGTVHPPVSSMFDGAEETAGRSSRLRQKASSPAFVELIAPKAVTLKECVIEIHKGGLVLPGLFAVAGGVMLIEERNTSERSVRFYFCSESDRTVAKSDRRHLIGSRVRFEHL